MRTTIVIVSLLLIVLGNSTARAHAFLDHASPLVGSTVPTAPREVTLSFTQNLEAAFSSVEVTDSGGARVDQGKPQISGSTMRVGLKSLTPGTYHVRWHVLSVDTHKTEGMLHLPRRQSVRLERRWFMCGPFISPRRSWRRAW